MAVQDPLDGVSTFVHVVDAGGFTSAAARMGVTRSAVGKAVAKLEAGKIKGRRFRVRMM